MLSSVGIALLCAFVRCEAYLFSTICFVRCVSYSRYSTGVSFKPSCVDVRLNFFICFGLFAHKGLWLRVVFSVLERTWASILFMFPKNCRYSPIINMYEL
jgi:hypothetical protein